MRKHSLQKLKERYYISITPIPKVKLQVHFRRDGSWSVDFGRVSYEALMKQGKLYDANGNYVYQGKRSMWVGQGEYIKSMWYYIRKSAYFGNIHPLDLVK